ncbi:MAG: hypothetical protein CM15mP4_3890 [Candidatus Neomarinimicrobiota bacterium]|nr:MAG: hypothetical protein CM15mP4_3890 [Candidatus Neomarinimicrobiota bacterium]
MGNKEYEHNGLRSNGDVILSNLFKKLDRFYLKIEYCK